jgi:hypothetical protein
MCGQTSKPSQTPSDLGLQPLELLYTEEWAIDCLDRLLLDDRRGSMTAFSYANLNLLKLPPGCSYAALEDFLQVLGVKLFHNQGSNQP